MILKYREELLQEREAAHKLYIEIVREITNDISTFRFNTLALKQAKRYYNNYVARLIRCSYFASRSVSKKRIKNIIKAMEIIRDKWRQIYMLLSVY